MDRDFLKQLLEKVQSGQIAIPDALQHLSDFPYENIGCARVDHHRALRRGFPEVIFGQGKTPEQVAAIFKALARAGTVVLATRATREQYQAVYQECPGAEYVELPRCIVLRQAVPEAIGRVAVVSAGTADQPVAEEAALTAELMGNRIDRIYDVGVAGLHRLLDQQRRLQQADVIVVVAGMEGALPSVVGGLVEQPVIAVPTSVGYGSGSGGWAALLAMLNSCVPGIGVVNIDNGYGAGALAAAITRLTVRPSTKDQEDDYNGKDVL